MTTLSSRLSSIQDRLAPLLHILTDPAFEARLGDPAACDFLLGNPQEMPLPGFVQALRDHLPPRNKDWYAYKMSEPEARRAVADGLRRWRGVAYDPEDILLTNGAFGGLRAVIDALAGPGDEVIFLSPPWFFYEPLILAARAEAVRVRVDPRTFDIDLQALGRAITPRTRAVIVNSPNNPTGRIYPPETLQGLASLLEEAGRRHGRPVYLISDEAYSRIIYNGKPFASPTAFYPHSFLIYTYGKTLLTPGQRIGFIALPPEMPGREAMRRALLPPSCWRATRSPMPCCSTRSPTWIDSPSTSDTCARSGITWPARCWSRVTSSTSPRACSTCCRVHRGPMTWPSSSS